MTQEEVIVLKTDDSVNIALWRISNTKLAINKHIFLTHGTFSDKKICLGIANYFTRLGYTCWILEWRNHGNSDKTKKNFDFETIAAYDIKTAFDYLYDTVNVQKVSCITHSGGGICLTLFLLKHQKYIPKIKSITFFSCQAFGACYNATTYYKILVSKYISAILGYIPGKKIGLGPHNEKYAIMKQWFNWNLSRNFIGKSGYDYLKNMALITMPILSICSQGDRFIAPKEGCTAYLEAFHNSKNELLFCSKEKGYSEDYDHSRILLSENSKNEIWPKVLTWVETHCLQKNDDISNV